MMNPTPEVYRVTFKPTRTTREHDPSAHADDLLITSSRPFEEVRDYAATLAPAGFDFHEITWVQTVYFA